MLSSKSESSYSLESDIPSRVKFNIGSTAKMQYHIDALQKTYVVIESFETLFNALGTLNWNDLCQKMKTKGD